jgi:hypothetical protein
LIDKVIHHHEELLVELWGAAVFDNLAALRPPLTNLDKMWQAAQAAGSRQQAAGSRQQAAGSISGSQQRSKPNTSGNPPR